MKKQNIQDAGEPRLTYTVTNAATRLDLGRTKMYEIVKSGAVRTVEIGGKTLIPESELQRYVAAQWAAQVGAE